MYSEIKYDGERVQVHKNGDNFSYFSRSLKPVLPHKVSLIAHMHRQHRCKCAPGPWSYLLINVTMLIRMQCVQVCPGRISSLKVFSQREIQTFPTVIFQHLLSQHDAQRLKRAGITSSASCSLAFWNCFGAHKTHFTTIIKKRMPSMAQVGKSHVALVRDVYTPYFSRPLMWKCSLCFLRHFKAWYLFLWCLRSTFSPLAWRLQTFCLEWPSCHCSPSAKWLIMQPQPL